MCVTNFRNTQMPRYPCPLWSRRDRSLKGRSISILPIDPNLLPTSVGPFRFIAALGKLCVYSSHFAHFIDGRNNLLFFTKSVFCDAHLIK